MHLFDFYRPSKAACGLLLALALLAAGGAAAQGPAADVTGLWIDHTGQGAVEIAPCGDRICGRVVWLKNPGHKSKSGKLICGTQILGDLQAASRQRLGVGLDLQSRGRGALQRRAEADQRQHAARHRLPRHQAARRNVHLEALDRDRCERCAPANRPT